MTISTVPGSVALEGGISLLELAQATGGRPCGQDVRCTGISTDTRGIAPGELFVALRGPHFDGYEFVAEAGRRGAAAVLVSREADGGHGLPAVIVDDTLVALGRLASWWRKRYAIPVVAVTGSNGKTTVKEMLARILSALGPGVVTRGNLNNEIGVPLTLLGLNSEHRYGVIEMGARGPGDIALLSGLAQPDVAVVTNAAPAHLAGFGDIAGVARAKGEIFSGLPAGGVAVVNEDDPRVGLWRVMADGRRIVSFGIRQAADVSARSLEPNDAPGCSFDLCMPHGRARVALRVPGRHNVMNALAAAAAAYGMGAAIEQIVAGLEAMAGVPRRLQLRAGVHGSRIIDDTYNANPGSMKAALEVLATCGRDGEKILVLGDMGELGNAAQALHEQIGRQARAIGVSGIHALGELACVAAGTFGPGSHHYPEREALIRGVREALHARAGAGSVTVLVKGSRFMRMELVADALAADGAGRNAGGSGGVAGPAVSGWLRGRED
ncbi:MAG: UDP-N-acetylmuramoyl-tripeptide--D-alanyl-D-alanine ligase [Gammaproteobacteria bacterium]|jgi:UDP-N-acetylmuramoyl-tripeptide--D-alanyl-D-alanine ligase|nr:UDP-N-acetylmuramoyl-tripeptide--D-alanyl-D-alanine ligase [Gammaproteobacteria bacterium]